MTDQRVAIVSGGSKGLGAGVVRALLTEGWRVGTFSRSPPPYLDQFPQGLLWRQVDATNPEALDSFVAEVTSTYGRVDALVNNAGAAVARVLTLTPREEISAVLRLNLESAIHLAQACTKVMLRQHGGSIVNVSSIVGLRGFSGLAAYSATKAGLDGFSRSLARELGSRGIRVNSIAPGYFDTEMSAVMSDEDRERIIRRTPLGRLGKVEDMLGLVSFLLSPAAGFITGQTFVVDGGVTC